MSLSKLQLCTLIELDMHLRGSYCLFSTLFTGQLTIAKHSNVIYNNNNIIMVLPVYMHIPVA